MSSWNWYVTKAALYRLLVVLGIVSWGLVVVLAFQQGSNPSAVDEFGSRLAEVCLIGN